MSLTKEINETIDSFISEACGKKSEKKIGLRESERSEKYQKFFQAKLKKFGVQTPTQLTGDKKKEFFNQVDKEWDATNETD